MLNCTNPGFPKTQLFESRGHGRVLHMPIVCRFGLGQRPAPARFSNYSVQPQAAGQVTCRPCSGNPSTETSNSTADRTALRGTYPDADDPPVEAAEATVSDLKAPELKPGRRQARKGGNPDTGRPMVGAAEIRRCRRTTEISQSRRSPITPCFWGIRGTQTNYRTAAMATRCGGR